MLIFLSLLLISIMIIILQICLSSFNQFFMILILIMLPDGPSGKWSKYNIYYLLIRSFKIILFLYVCFWAYILSCFILVLDYGSRWLDSIFVIKSFSSLIYFFFTDHLPIKISFGCWLLCGWIIKFMCQSVSAWHHSSA